MNFLRKIKNRIAHIVKRDKTFELFFTKDIFANKKFEIGEYTYGHPEVLFENPEANLYIGKFCSIAEGVSIFLGGNHRVDWITTYPFNVINTEFPIASEITGHPSTKGDVWIGNDVWIGRNTTILSGIVVGNGSVLAANSVVTKNIGPYEIWGGNPAKKLKDRFTQEQKDELLSIEWWNWSIDKIEQNIETLCSDRIYILKKNS